MNPPQLKSYIPVGGALMWVPVTGDEPPMRFVPGFDLQWYHRRLGVDFTSAWHTDPVRRYEALLAMTRLVGGLFPQLPDFRLAGGGVEPRCATISGVHGIMTLYKLYGGPVRYQAGGPPEAAVRGALTPEALGELPPFDLAENPVVSDLLAQIDTLAARYGCATGYLNYQGPLNVAFQLCGTDIFTVMLDDPELAGRVFGHIARTIRDLARLIQARQRATGFDVDLIGSSNCVVNMISPAMYEEQLLAWDRYLALPFRWYAVHTCNWNVTPYLPALAQLPNVGYIDLGSASDYDAVRAAFPLARRNVLFSPTVMHLPRAERAAMVDRLADALLPCDISMGSIDASVPDDEVTWLAGYIAGHPANR